MLVGSEGWGAIAARRLARSVNALGPKEDLWRHEAITKTDRSHELQFRDYGLLSVDQMNGRVEAKRTDRAKPRSEQWGLASRAARGSHRLPLECLSAS